jgi:hypothetical protein
MLARAEGRVNQPKVSPRGAQKADNGVEAPVFLDFFIRRGVGKGGASVLGMKYVFNASEGD